MEIGETQFYFLLLIIFISGLVLGRITMAFQAAFMKKEAKEFIKSKQKSKP